MAECADDAPAWQALGSGYLVMRVFDDWLILGPARIAFDLRHSQIFATIATIPEAYQQERRVLETALQLLINASGTDPDPVVGPLLAYAAILETRNAWGPAADVYQTVAYGLTDFHGNRQDLASIALVRLREGQCWRNAQEYEHAVAAYEAAGMLAEIAKNDVLRLQGRLGLANVARVRGALPVAETALDEILEDAERCSLLVAALLRPAVLHSRGVVRLARGRYDEALADLYAAYCDTSDLLERELVLADLGACASVACYRDTARNALEVIALTAHRPLARQFALVNLLEIAVLDENQLAFERWRSALVLAECIPLAQAHAKLYLARGVERFQGQDQALSAFQEAAHYAATAGIHQVEFEALGDIDRLKQAAMAPITAATPLPPSLSYVGEALAELRVFVGLKE